MILYQIYSVRIIHSLEGTCFGTGNKMYSFVRRRRRSRRRRRRRRKRKRRKKRKKKKKKKNGKVLP
jgi:hypothetical protein